MRDEAWETAGPDAGEDDPCAGAKPCEGLPEYAVLYAETYGNKEEVAELIPFMLEAFLESDVEYTKVKGRAHPQGGV